MTGIQRPFWLQTSAALVVASIMLGGCSWDMRKGMGLVSEGPDESQVVLKRPLQMPDSLPQTVAELPEPRIGARSLVEPEPIRDAQIVLEGAERQQAATASAVENALLNAAGANQADASIRDVIAAESDAKKKPLYLLDELLGRDPETSGAILDAEAEARRLSAAARAGKNPALEVLPETTR